MNGHKLTDEEVASPEKRLAVVKKLLMKDDKKAKHAMLMMSLLVPSLYAVDIDPMWLVLGGLAIGGIGFLGGMAYQKHADGSDCAITTPSCCYVNGQYMMNSNGCCQTIGGSGVASTGTCGATATTPTLVATPPIYMTQPTAFTGSAGTATTLPTGTTAGTGGVVRKEVPVVRTPAASSGER